MEIYIVLKGLPQIYNIAVTVEQIVCIAVGGYEVGAAEVGIHAAALHFADHSTAVQQELCSGKAKGFRITNTLCVVGVGNCAFAHYGGNKLIKPVIRMGNSGGVVHIQLRQQIAVVIVGVGNEDVFSRLVADLADKAVVGVVGVGGGARSGNGE